MSFKENVVSLLYTLLRDHVAPGVMEIEVRDVEKHADDLVSYSNKHIESYARELVDRLDKTGDQQEEANPLLM